MQLRTLLGLSALLMIPLAGQGAGTCGTATCAGNADAIITAVKMDNINGDVLLNIAPGARGNITSCTLATGGWAKLQKTHPAFVSLYPTLLQAITTGQWITMSFQAAAGCPVVAVVATSTPISTPATGGSGGGGGGCSLMGCTQ